MKLIKGSKNDEKTSIDILFITIGGLTFAIGINYFTLPNLLSEGGIIGFTIIAHYLFQWSPGIINFKKDVEAI